MAPLLMLIEVYCDVRISSLSAEIVNLAVEGGDSQGIILISIKMLTFAFIAVAAGGGSSYSATHAELLTVSSALNRLMQERTTFVIAHRLSTVRNSDKIIVLEAGEMLEMGSHEELLSLQGKYVGYYEMIINKKKRRI